MNFPTRFSEAKAVFEAKGNKPEAKNSTDLKLRRVAFTAFAALSGYALFKAGLFTASNGAAFIAVMVIGGLIVRSLIKMNTPPAPKAPLPRPAINGNAAVKAKEPLLRNK